MPDGSILIRDELTGLKRKVIYLKVRNGCFADVAIIHKMGHVIYASERGDSNGDPNHQDKAWWSVIDKMNARIVTKFCLPDYVRDDIPPTELVDVDTTN